MTRLQVRFHLLGPVLLTVRRKMKAEGANPSGLHIEGPVWRNIKSHVVHKCAELSFQTACGRKVDEAHFELLGARLLHLECKMQQMFQRRGGVRHGWSGESTGSE